MARGEFESVFELTEAKALDAQSWSDNLACVAVSINDAARNLMRWDHFLQTVFHMRLKRTSMVVVPSRSRKLGDSVIELDGARWKVVDRELMLGNWLTTIVEDKSERAAIMNAWRRVFWRRMPES